MEKFATLQEIIEIYCISRKLVRNVLRHYKVDFYKKEDDIQSSSTTVSHGYGYNEDLTKDHDNTFTSDDGTDEDDDHENEYTQTYDDIDGDSLSGDE